MSIRFTVETGLQLLIQHKHDNDKFMNHCCAVADHAAKALEHERLTPRKRLAVELAALLHDLDDKQYFPESTNNQNTRSLLRATISIDNLDDFIEEVVMLINFMYCDNEEPQCAENINNYRNCEPWMYIPRDCDCLETLSMDNFNRRMSVATHNGKLCHGPNTKRAYSTQEVLDITTTNRFNSNHNNSVIDYCYDYLLHLARPEILKSQNSYIMDEGNKRVDNIAQAVVSYWLNLSSLS